MINSINTTLPLNQIRNINTGNEEKKDASFSDFLKKAVYDVSNARKYEEELARQLVTGELKNMHELSIARTVANVKFQALAEGTTKIIEAYKEISRIQV